MDLRISEMLDMQRQLQHKYLAKWGGLHPGKAPNQLLWMMGEAGEVIDIVKKINGADIAGNPGLRARFVEEMTDVLMYFNDVLLCFDITPEEFSQAYADKMAHNMRRDYEEEHHEKFGV